MDVNTIFKDLATMVHEQGETIDSIEGNVEQASITVHDGTDQLRQAERYKVNDKKYKNNVSKNQYFWNFIYFYLFYFIFMYLNVISEQSEKEESMPSSFWDSSTGSGHWNNSLGYQKIN